MAVPWVALKFQCMLIVVSLISAYPDEFLPKRIFSDQKDILPTKSDISLPSQGNKDFSPIQSCGIQCFLKPPLYEMVTCDNPISQSVYGTRKLIACSQHLERGEIVLGQKESVRGILPGALESLIKVAGDNLLRTGQMSIHINLNMVNLDKGVFQGLSTVVSEVRILNTVYIHPDSLMELKHLRLFEVETGRPPLTLASNNTENSKETPGYFRIRPADLSAPITFNMETRCYRCGHDSEPVIVITFKDNRRQVTSRQLGQSGLNIVFPYSCPNQAIANGCPGNGSVIGDAASSGDNESGSDSHVTAPATEDRTPSVLILLSIWCTVLTIVVIMVVCILYLCSRHLRQFRMPTHRQKQQWLSNLCPYSPSSTEEVSSDSTNSAFIPKHTLSSYVHHTAEHPDGTGLSNSQCPSAVAIRSKSSHSLRDRARVSTQTCGGQLVSDVQSASTRRSIGSQTDFTTIDLESDIFSSMRRSQLNASQRSSYIFAREPLSRTVSHHTLTRPRNGFPRNDSSAYSSKRQSANLNAVLMQLGQGPEVEFLMTGCTAKTPATQAFVKSSKRPPIYPAHRHEHSPSPVPWSNSTHYTSIMDS